MAISLEIALSIVQEILGQSKLTEVQETVFRGVWAKQSYQEIINHAAQNGFYYSLGHLKNTGSELWQSLSDALDERVTKNNLPTLLERYQQQHQTAKPDRQDWGEAVLPAQFYGRTRELTTLKSWITKDQCRVVALLGMGGMGKTSLAIKLGQEILETTQYERIFWRSLLNAPAIDCILQELIQFLADQQEVEIAATVEGKITQVLAYLRQTRCLVVLDNIESILQDSSSAGAYRPDYEAYGLLIQRFAEAEHSSCLLLTSREKPREVAWAEGPNLLVRSFLLKGLTFSAGQTIFHHKGCFGLDDQALQKLFNHYAGNPLALNMVASGVQELFDGDLKELLPYMQQGWLRFDDINDVLDRQFDRLSSAEQEVMYWLAINREPVSHLELMEDIVSVTVKQQLLEALKSLVRRCLIERNEKYWSLQPVVMEYVTNRLLQQVCREVVQQDYALFNSHALLKAQSKDYVRQAQSHSILQPLIDTLITQLGGSKNVDAQLREILKKLRIEAPLQSGYAGGNTLNLLRRLGSDLNHLDCSHLKIWQADLQGATLHNVNFSHADLAKSVFTETLGVIISLTFSPDGNYILSGDSDGQILMLQVSNWQRLLAFEGHQSWIWCVCFSPNGLTFASGSSDHTVKLWHAHTGECLRTFYGHTGWVWSVCFSPDGKSLASAASDHTIKLWNIDTGECEQTLQEHENGVWSVLFTPDGKSLISSSDDKTIKIWNVQNSSCLKTLRGHEGTVFSIALSTDGQTLASACFDHTVRLWDLATGNCIKVLYGHTSTVLSVCFSSDGKTLASSGRDCSIKLWNLTDGRCLRTLQGHTARIFSLSFSPNGQLLASGSDDKTLRFWHPHAGQCIKVLQGYSNEVRAIAFSPDGNNLVSSHGDKVVRVWQIDQQRCTKTLHGHTSWGLAVAFSPNGRLIASSNDDKTIRIWCAETGKCLRTFTGNPQYVVSVGFSSDNQLLVSGGGETLIRLWHIDSGKLVKTIETWDNRVWSVVFHPNNHLLASGGQDKTVKLWDIQTEECLKAFEGHDSIVFSVVFSPDGKLIASGSDDRTVRIWEVETGRCLQVLEGHSAIVLSVAFSPNSRLLASGSDDGTVRVWDVESGDCRQILQAHTSGVFSVNFSPDGYTLASGSQDSTIRLWDIHSYTCSMILQNSRPYEQMNIFSTTSLTNAQFSNLRKLGAVETITYYYDHPQACSL